MFKYLSLCGEVPEGVVPPHKVRCIKFGPNQMLSSGVIARASYPARQADGNISTPNVLERICLKPLYQGGTAIWLSIIFLLQKFTKNLRKSPRRCLFLNKKTQ